MRSDPANELSQRTHQPSSGHGGPYLGSSPLTNGSAKSETNGYHTNGYAENAVAVRDKEPFFGHNREEVTRILLQSLSDLGYHSAAQQLSRDSGYELEIPSVAAFRNAVLCGDWEEAEILLLGPPPNPRPGPDFGNRQADVSSWRNTGSSMTLYGGQNGSAKSGLPLAEGANTTALKFLLRQQKYLELLEKRDLGTALVVLRTELTPLKTDVARLHFLSSLVMCQSAKDVRFQADWDGVQGQSRHHLLSEVSKSISPSVMIPEHRLATLFSCVQDEQIMNCRYHNTTDQPSLYTDHECPADDFPLHTLCELQNHSDEVWYLEFSHDGSMLATAGKDGLVCVYETARWSLKHEFREHERRHQASGSGGASAASDNRGVCYVAFSPDDQYLISCSQNNEFVVVNVRNGQVVATADHFDYMVTTAAWLPDSQTFVIGSQGSRRPLGLYSLRPTAGGPTTSATGSGAAVVRNAEIHSWRDPPWDLNAKDTQPTSFRITDCAVSADGQRMVAATIDNRIMLFSLNPATGYCKLADWKQEDKLTSITFSRDGDLLLVNMNEGRVLALNSETGEVVCRYDGATQREYVIRSAFGGAGEGFVISGSEDSRVHIWRRQTGVQVAALDGHTSGTVNAVSWHPTNPAVFASAGDDRRVRIWSSVSARRNLDLLDVSAGPTARHFNSGGDISGGSGGSAGSDAGFYPQLTR